MGIRAPYTWWQAGAFWFAWLALLLPAYGAAIFTWLIGSMLPYYHEPMDIALALIAGSSLLLIIAIAIYTLWHYWQHSQPYISLMSLVLVALVAIPLIASISGGYLFAQSKAFELELANQS
ncbi:MAG: hypothetical protein WBP46_20185 [Thiolinea sp.]